MEPILVEVPATFKDVAPVLQRLLAFAAAAHAQATTDQPLRYADLEHALAVGTAALERALHQPVLAALARDDPRLMIGGVVHRRVLESTTSFYTRTGPVEVPRWLYRPVGVTPGPTVDPVALRVGAVRGTWLPATAAAMAFLVQQSPAREAEATARQLGVLPYSDSSFYRVMLAVGERFQQHGEAIESALIARYVVPAAATGLTASLDRVSTPIEVPRRKPRGRPRKKAAKRPVKVVWRMAYCATITLHDATGTALHSLRYGCMSEGDGEALVASLFEDVQALRTQRPDLTVGTLCDGAPEMWNLLGTAFTDTALKTAIRRLVDLWHLLQYVGAALRLRHGEAHVDRELQRWKLRLLNDSAGATKLLAELRGWPPGVRSARVGKAAPVTDAIRFITNQVTAGRVDYAAARRAGQPVGSGPCEATCKSLFNVRIKRSGARWKEPLAEHVINLRALNLSQRWDPAMALLHEFSYVEVRSVAASG